MVSPQKVSNAEDVLHDIADPLAVDFATQTDAEYGTSPMIFFYLRDTAPIVYISQVIL